MRNQAKVILGLATMFACGKEPTQEIKPPLSSSSALSITEVWLDAANSPRGDYPLIAGEPILFGFRIRGGEPPYKVNVHSQHTQKDSTPAPLHAQLTVEPENADSKGLEVGAAGAIESLSISGAYSVEVSATDANNKEAKSTPIKFSVVGVNEQFSLKRGANNKKSIHVVDAMEKRRTAYFPGERIQVRAFNIPTAKTSATLTIEKSKKKVLKRESLTDHGNGLRIPIDLPRELRGGIYIATIRFSRGRRQEFVSTEFEIKTPPPETTKKMRARSMSILGGAKLRAPRGAILRRKEQLVAETEVLDARTAPSGQMVIRRPDRGEILRKDLTLSNWNSSFARVFLKTDFSIPENAPKGKAIIEIRITEGRNISSLFREIQIL